MEKRSRSRRLRKPSIVKETTGESPPKTVRLVCVLGTGKKVTQGSVTGKRYEFIKNLPLEVDEKDAESLLAIKRGGCCGNQPSHIFVKVD